ncbi:MAG: peroxiredoxin [Flavobacteriales bacterium]|jgi:peroxiredoxin
MARTLTTQIPLGFTAPDFKLKDASSDAFVSFSDIKGEKGTVVMFICNHCPFVVHVLDGIIAVAETYQNVGFGFVAISSNDADNYPQDGPEFMKSLADENAFPFPYLYDESQEIAKAYDAACTPDFAVFDAHDICVYRGQLDDARPGNGVEVTGEHLRKALDQIKNGGEPAPEGQKPSIGCNIKWK